MSEDKLSREEKDFLLQVARATLARKLNLSRGKDYGETDAKAAGPNLLEKRGCFVTLHTEGRLRGCIGIFEGRDALWKNIEEMAVQAAFHDPRFPPLSSEEFDKIDIEISVLSPLKKIDDVDEIIVGEHGVYMTRGFNRGVLLPQVATEQGWDRDTFLDHTCLKAGLDTECWKNPETSIEMFSAEVFGEKENKDADGCQSV